MDDRHTERELLSEQSPVQAEKGWNQVESRDVQRDKPLWPPFREVAHKRCMHQEKSLSQICRRHRRLGVLQRP